MLNGLDLFSGIGGLTLALSPWVRPSAYCENDKYAQAVLLSRQSDGSLPRGPIWDDVRTLSGDYLPSIDIVYGGFPCQDISVAGLGKGLAGERSGLFFEVLRLVREVSPRFVFLEDVPAIRTRGLRQVVGSLTEIGFDCRWTLVSAEEMGAPHKRVRWFLLAAHPERLQLWDEQGRGSGESRVGAAEFRDDGAGRPLADTNSEQCQAPFGESWWAVEPDVGRVAHGVQARVDRIRGLGNAVVPAQAREAFCRLAGISGRREEA